MDSKIQNLIKAIKERSMEFKRLPLKHRHSNLGIENGLDLAIQIIEENGNTAD